MSEGMASFLHNFTRCFKSRNDSSDTLPGLPLKGKNILARRFQRPDEEARQQWAKFTDPHLVKYNFAPKKPLRNEIIFQKLRGTIRLAVDDLSGTMIGYVSLKTLMDKPEVAFLGICFSADRVSKGFGSEALGLILPWASEVLGIKRILLQVDAVNLRAIKLYGRFGFAKIGESWRADNNPLLRRRLKSGDHRYGLRMRRGSVEVLTWEMEWRAEKSED